VTYYRGRTRVEDDLDLEGLSVSEARSYVAQFISSLHTTRSQLQEAEEELAAWKKRTDLAAGRGEMELARAALSRAEEAHTQVAQLRRDARDLEFKVDELKRRLGKMIDKPKLSTNADALLSQLESVVGTNYETDRSIAEAEAELELEKLRKRMAEEQDKT
jgi:phage shock protein A